MSKLEELVQQYCSDGVPYKKLKDVSIMQRGTSLTKAQATEGNIPVISGGREPAFFCNQSNREGETITVAGSGAGAGYVQYWDIPIFANDCFTVKGDKEVLTKYLYYCLANQQQKIYDTKKGGGVPHVHISDIDMFEVPLPALPVQKEIVRILDEFSLLSVELATELAARKKQYAHFLYKILSFTDYDGDLKNNTIGEICSVGTGAKPRATTEETTDFEYINAGTSRSGYCNEFNREGDVTTTPSRGQGGIGFVGYQSKKFWLGPLCYAIRSNKPELLINKYIYYWLSAHNNLILQFKNEGGTPSLNKTDLESIIITYPSIKEQKRIVDTLNFFKSLTEDLYEGIPAEIEVRQKQYEHYRDRLLTFKKKES